MRSLPCLQYLQTRWRRPWSHRHLRVLQCLRRLQRLQILWGLLIIRVSPGGSASVKSSGLSDGSSDDLSKGGAGDSSTPSVPLVSSVPSVPSVPLVSSGESMERVRKTVSVPPISQRDSSSVGSSRVGSSHGEGFPKTRVMVTNVVNQVQTKRDPFMSSTQGAIEVGPINVKDLKGMKNTCRWFGEDRCFDLSCSCGFWSEGDCE